MRGKMPSKPLAPASRSTRVGADDAPLPSLPPPMADMASPERIPLGTRVVDGRDAQGALYRQTIPAGAFGNAEPIVIESETWHATVEGIVLPLRSVVRDPINGITISELCGVHALTPEELDARFRPDAGWTLMETETRELPMSRVLEQ